MKKTWNRISLVVLALILCLTAVGCGSQTTPTTPPVGSSDDSNSSAQSNNNSTNQNDEALPEKSKEEDSLFITLDGQTYTSYSFDGEQTPENLLSGIEELTGWNLSLADKITDGKGGMSVIFASDACLFSGPPEEQIDDFHVYDASQFTLAVLGSVQRTLQNWASSTDPSSVDIYFGMDGDQPLDLDTLGVTWPLDAPYSYDEMIKLIYQS